MAELDRNRPFDRVWGIVADDEPYFFQDGKSFTADGKEIISAPATESVEPSSSEPESQATEPKTEVSLKERRAFRKPAKLTVDDLIKSEEVAESQTDSTDTSEVADFV